jgi:anti-anti-sigma factor
LKTTELFAVEQIGVVLVISPLCDFRELTSDELLQGDPAGLMELLENGLVQHVVVNCSRVDSFSSAGFAYLIRLWKKAQAGGGMVVICHASAHLQQSMDVLHLSRLWNVTETQDQALALVPR